MTGPEHYREAERLLEMAENPPRIDLPEVPEGLRPDGIFVLPEVETVRVDGTLAAAQVHATLALAAATALGAFDPQGRPLVTDGGPWAVVA